MNHRIANHTLRATLTLILLVTIATAQTRSDQWVVTIEKSLTVDGEKTAIAKLAAAEKVNGHNPILTIHCRVLRPEETKPYPVHVFVDFSDPVLSRDITWTQTQDKPSLLFHDTKTNMDQIRFLRRLAWAQTLTISVSPIPNSPQNQTEALFVVAGFRTYLPLLSQACGWSGQ